MSERPELYQTRIVVVDGVERLAYDFARSDGKPVAVTGAFAVPCPKCGQKAGDRCRENHRPKDVPHFERMMAMNREFDRLKREAAE